MAIKDCFASTPHESLDNCPNEEITAGISTRLLYAPADFLEKCTLPAAQGEYDKRISIADGEIALKSDKTWKGIDVMIDEGELKYTLVGNTGNKKAKTELEAYIPGFRPKVLGFLDTYKNVPMVFIIRDAAGVLWVVGNKINPAYMESVDATTGKKAEDNSGATIKIIANSKLYKYEGAIVES